MAGAKGRGDTTKDDDGMLIVVARPPQKSDLGPLLLVAQIGLPRFQWVPIAGTKGMLRPRLSHERRAATAIRFRRLIGRLGQFSLAG